MLFHVQRNQMFRRFLYTSQHFDLIVIGGGSGGLSCSKRASDLGAKVALIDAVAPTPHGVSWGLGGTCANVGCIPKKFMHQAALVGKELQCADTYGWKGIEKSKISHEWEVLVKNVNDRIKANNWIYRVQLNQKNIKYYNGFAEFSDKSSIMVTGVGKKKTQAFLTAPKVVISTGLRPHYPDIPGAGLGISSDDLFSLPTVPGKTLIVGGGYVALECAGFLAGLQQDVEVLVRSTPLKGFDQVSKASCILQTRDCYYCGLLSQNCVRLVMQHLRSSGVKVKQHMEVERVEGFGNMKKVYFTNNGQVEEYDTVIWATGRSPRLDSLKLEKVGVGTDKRSSKIFADEYDQTSTSGVYAIGDVVEGRQELTPLAIQSGKLLADRLFAGSKQTVRYDGVATTVFTPLELSAVGRTEEEAVEMYGEGGIEVFHSHFTPFEFVVPQNKDSEFCYVKVICTRDESRKVLGLHFVGPNAAEVMQGYAVAFHRGISFSDLEGTIAIHPCSAEEFVKLNVTKRSGKDPRTQGCCG